MRVRARHAGQGADSLGRVIVIKDNRLVLSLEAEQELQQVSPVSSVMLGNVGRTYICSEPVVMPSVTLEMIGSM